MKLPYSKKYNLGHGLLGSFLRGSIVRVAQCYEKYMGACTDTSEITMRHYMWFSNNICSGDVWADMVQCG